VSLTLAQALVVAALLVSSGVLTVVWRRERGGALAGLPALAAGVAVAMAAAGRFAGRQDPASGEEMAALVVLMGLAAAILGAAWTRGSVAR
jgi:multisubunit Na+/H+ antiporter MnhC subunit